MTHEALKKRDMLWGGVVVVVAVLAFAGGMSYGKSTVATRGGNGSPYSAGPGASGGRGRMMGGGFTAGAITAKDANSITVTLTGGPNGANGSSSGARIVLVGSSTQIAKSTAGTLDDLTIGQEVTVSGTPNADGSITAQSVQIRPAGSHGPGMGGRPQGAAPTGN